MGALPDNARYERTEEFVARAIAGETVLVPLRKQIGDLGEIYTLNEVGTVIWERLADQPTVAEIAATLEATFAAEPIEIRRDLEEFLEHLVTIEAIRPIDGPSETRGPTPRC